jgi:hypothetical protein
MAVAGIFGTEHTQILSAQCNNDLRTGLIQPVCRYPGLFCKNLAPAPPVGISAALWFIRENAKVHAGSLEQYRQFARRGGVLGIIPCSNSCIEQNVGLYLW